MRPGLEPWSGAGLASGELVMSENRWFLVVLAKAAITTSIGSCAMGAGVVLLIGPTARVQEEAIGLASCLLPFAIGSWWIFRKFQARYSRRLARSVSTTFAICTPIFLCGTMPFGLITGGYAEAATGSRIAIVLGAFLGPIVLTTALSFAVCLVARSATRQMERNDG